LIAERREVSRQLERKMGLNGSSVAHLARQPRQKTELISASLGCRFQLPHLKTSGTVAARGLSVYRRGLPNVGSLGQKIVGANTVDD
jgi:hypothetical protein